MEFQDSTYLKVNGPACTIAAMDVLTYTRIMHQHTKAQFLASTSPSPPAEISSSPHTSPLIKPVATKPDPVTFDSGNLHLPPPTATSASTTTTTTTGASPETNPGITATTIITTTINEQAHPETQQPAVHSSIHSRRASAANSALHHSPGFLPAPASAPLTTRHSPSPSSSPTAQPLAAHFDAAATANSSAVTTGAMADAHRRRSSAGLRKLSAGLAKLGLWRGGQHAADHSQQHHHDRNDQHQSHGPDERQEGQRQAAESEVEHGVPAMAQLQCECGACDWCRLRSEGLKRNGLCNVGVGGPGLVGVAAGRRDTV
ncbi:uncharacterized protein J3D65DRAFT_350848 [Phyllosticta citribraziliensis]|uniref:Uncharacterized protein n=1 Tax=Phyllosticta citribraziliensis TaxID=989973 RepID=A0ABR1LXH5_9PEZI